jgi:hypothetical protein
MLRWAAKKQMAQLPLGFWGVPGVCFLDFEDSWQQQQAGQD